MIIQWNFSNMDTVGIKIIVLISEVSLFQGEAFILGVHDMQQASRKAEPGNYKHAVNDM